MAQELTEGEKLHGKWFIMYKQADNFDPKNIDFKNFKYIHAPSNFFYADPIGIKHNGEFYIFYETFDYNKGSLAYFKVDKTLISSASRSDKTTNLSQNILDIDIKVHTSYPHIFTDNDKIYMIPETCHMNKINLYECEKFPSKWIFKKTLVDNVHSGDNTPIFHNGKYWMFCTIYDNNINHFCIYHADSLLGEWKEHKICNTRLKPIGDNEKVTRDAGNVFELNGKLYRPAQYSDDGINGEGVILYEIRNLTEDTYHEVPINIILEPVEGVRAVHTFSYRDGVILMDGRETRDTDHPYKEINKKKIMNNINDKNAYINHDLLKEAFNMNTSGNGRCYYEIKLGDVSYEGERNWDDRWNLIKDCIDWEGKNVLEIGCNMGILLTYLKKFRNIGLAVGIDETDEMLAATNKAKTIEAAKLLDKAFGLEDKINYVQVDLNDPDVRYKGDPDHFMQSSFGQKYDVVAAMSILKWIDRKEEFLDYLAEFKHVLYEGHDSDEEEIKRFTDRGFDYFILGSTQTGRSYAADNFRTLFLFTKK